MFYLEVLNKLINLGSQIEISQIFHRVCGIRMELSIRYFFHNKRAIAPQCNKADSVYGAPSINYHFFCEVTNHITNFK